MRKLGSVATKLKEAAADAREALGSVSGMQSGRDDTALDLAQAVVLLARAAGRFDDNCGLPDPQFDPRRHGTACDACLGARVLCHDRSGKSVACRALSDSQCPNTGHYQCPECF